MAESLARILVGQAHPLLQDFYDTLDLDSLAAARQWLTGIPADARGEDLARALEEIGGNLWRIATASESPDALQVLDGSIETQDLALRALPQQSDLRPVFQARLALALIERDDLVLEEEMAPSKSSSDLARAISLAEQGLSAVGADAPPGSNRDLLSMELRRALATAIIKQPAGGDDSLERAATIERQLTEDIAGRSDAELAAQWEQGSATLRAWIGNAFGRRYEERNDPADLDEAIPRLRSATAVMPAYASELAVALVNRFRRFGRHADVDEAIEVAEWAKAGLEATEAPPDLISRVAASLDAAIRAREMLAPEPERQDQLIDRFRAALAADPADDPRRIDHLVLLANALADRHSQDGPPEDLDEAIRLYEEAVALAPAQSVDRHELELDLGQAFVDRFDRDGRLDDLGHALASLEAALAAFPPGSVKRPNALNDLGLALAREARIDPDGDAVPRGIDAFREAVTTGAELVPAVAVIGARAWGRWATEREAWAEAAEAYELGIAAMSRLAVGETDVASAERWLTAGREIPAEAGYVLARVGDPARAVTALERGRAILLAHALERADGAADASHGPTSRSASDPLVYVGAAGPGGYALIVRPERPGVVEHVPLDDLRRSALEEAVTDYLTAYADRDARREAWDAAIDRAGAWLWDVAVGSLIEALGGGGAVLVPIGALGLLPLHAAWRPDPAAPTRRHFAIDDLRLTFAPSARALDYASRDDETPAPEGVLVVEDPQPVSAPALRYASREAEFALAFGGPTLRLRKQRARLESVLPALDHYGVLHFACHAHADVGDPLRSALVLAGDTGLELAELQARQLGARLAVLSACETAIIGFKLADEVVGLPTGLIQAGVRGVVASLWAVNDRSTLLLMARFYRLMGQDVHPAEALRQAQRWLRDATNAEKRSEYPELDATAPPAGLSDAQRRFWDNARAHARPYHWAAFTYTGWVPPRVRSAGLSSATSGASA